MDKGLENFMKNKNFGNIFPVLKPQETRKASTIKPSKRYSLIETDEKTCEDLFSSQDFENFVFNLKP